MSYVCDYCKKTFVRENSLAKHMCEKKRRYMQRDTKPVQLGFRAYQLFYKIGGNSKKPKTYDDLVYSNYYSGFVKFGHYAVDLGIDDIEAYVKYLLLNQVPLDRWCSDRHFTAWRTQRTRVEQPARALERTIMFLQEWAKDSGEEWSSYWETVNPNLAAFHISTGRISPWVVYASDKAQNLIGDFNSDQIKMVQEMLDPDHWERAKKSHYDDFVWIKGILDKSNL